MEEGLGELEVLVVGPLGGSLGEADLQEEDIPALGPDTTLVTMVGVAALGGLAWVWVVDCYLDTLWGG